TYLTARVFIMASNPDSFFVDSALLQQAERLCQARLQNDPENRAFLRSLAEVQRKLGNLAGAAALYERLFRLDAADQLAGYTAAVLGGRDWPIPPDGLRAAPFVLLKDFLPQDFHDTLLPFVTSIQEKFLPAKVKNAKGSELYE